MKYLKEIVALLGAFIGWFIGYLNGFVLTLITFIVIDYITGVVKAYFEKDLSSEIGFKGIIRKVMIFIVVGIGNLLDKFVIRDGDVLRTAVIFFYVSNEALSILENLSIIGVPIPKKIKDTLKQLKKK